MATPESSSLSPREFYAAIDRLTEALELTKTLAANVAVHCRLLEILEETIIVGKPGELPLPSQLAVMRQEMNECKKDMENALEKLGGLSEEETKGKWAMRTTLIQAAGGAVGGGTIVALWQLIKAWIGGGRDF